MIQGTTEREKDDEWTSNLSKQWPENCQCFEIPEQEQVVMTGVASSGII